MVRGLRRAVGLAWLALVPAAQAVMFASTSNVTYNTTAPTGALTNSGWQWQGGWLGSYLATPIAPRYFITAGHFGGNVGDPFNFSDGVHHTTAMFTNSSNDLRVYQVAETFPTFASLYTNADEVGKHCVVFGRGTQRRAPVIVSGVTNGWQWGPGDAVVRWGENDVTEIANGGPTLGEFLRVAFDRGGGSNECHLSVGDSGGALFIQDGTDWKLAGIHYAVDGPFSNATYGVINAALLDRGGFCEADGSACYADIPADDPSAFYSTRISANVAWINSVIDSLPGNDLGVTGVQAVTNGAQINFVTGTNKSYVLQWRTNLTTGVWTALTNLTGSGGVMSATDPGATNSSPRFYRVGLVP